MNILIRKIDDGNRGSGCAIQDRSEAESVSPVWDAVFDPLDKKSQVAGSTEEDALSVSSNTLINDSDSSSEVSLPTPSSTTQGECDIGGGNDCFSCRSTDAPSRRYEKGHVYERLTSMSESVQINGDVLTSFSIPRTDYNYYLGATSSGKSWQINGNLDLESFLQFVKVR